MTQTRRERLREATYEEIKSIAQRQMQEQGAASLSLRGIAAEMGMTAPALYRYFASRDDLVTVLIADAYNSQADAIVATDKASAGLTYGARFLALALTFRQWGLDHPAQFALIYGSPIPGYHAPVEVTTPAALRANLVFIRLIETAWAEGRIYKETAYTTLRIEGFENLANWLKTYQLEMPLSLYLEALAGQGMMHGLVSLELNGQYHYMGVDQHEFFRLHIVAFLKNLGLAVEQ